MSSSVINTTMMKILSALFLSLQLNSYLVYANNLRQSAASSCNSVTNKDACWLAKDAVTGAACSWCEAGAIPSECMSQDQARDLPAGVFQCSTPSVYQTSGPSVVLRAQEVQDDDFCDPTSKRISGYVDISGSDYDSHGEDKHLFFWFHEKRGDFDENTSMIIWLTGGPGCSSTLALLTENGPCSVNPDGETTTINPYSWTETAHVLWLDQPAGVGYSYGSETDANEKMVSEDAYYFLQGFFKKYPEYSKSPFYVVGESYAGHYVPAISHRIYRGNQKLRDGDVKINFAGLAIGNGLTNPEEQYKWYPEMGHNNSHHLQIFSDSEYETMMEVVPRCTSLIQTCNSGDGAVSNFACQTAFLVCNTGLTSPYQATGLNPYDIRKECDKPPLCYDFDHINKFLRSDKTKKALNVDAKHSHQWTTCNFGINMKFHTDWMKDFSGYVGDLLDAGYPALIYVGDVDFICNYMGNKAWTLGLNWNGKSEFSSAEVHDWKGKASARSANGLTYLEVFDAGHMVPSDQPEAALDMIRTFVSGGSF